MRLAMRVGGGVAVAAALLGVSAPGAGAAGPEKVPFSGGGSVIDTDLCGFPIDISYEWSGFDLLFFDDGDLVRIQSHARETDTVSANGVTLVGDPYTFNADIRFSDGEVVDYDVSGQLSKVRLPMAACLWVLGEPTSSPGPRSSSSHLTTAPRRT
jgi:hypothetical protein